MTASPHLKPILWCRTRRAEFPYEADVDGLHWQVRVGDFPAEALYTLLIDGREVAGYDEWPAAWKRPD